jgi:hypothetical protein
MEQLDRLYYLTVGMFSSSPSWVEEVEYVDAWLCQTSSAPRVQAHSAALPHHRCELEKGVTSQTA